MDHKAEDIPAEDQFGFGKNKGTQEATVAEVDHRKDDGKRRNSIDQRRHWTMLRGESVRNTGKE